MKNTTKLGLVFSFVVALTSCDKGTSSTAPSSLTTLSGQRVRVDFRRPIPDQSYAELSAKGETQVARRFYIEGNLLSADSAGILLQEDKLKRWINMSEVAIVSQIDK